jgi:type I restriction enzyme S subunit
LRFPEFEGEWEKKILNDTCTIVGGGTPDSGKEEFWNGHIQWFTPTEIKMDYVSKSERTITELGLKKSSARLLPDGTILLTSRATIGEVAIALNECTTNQGFQSIIVNKSYNNLFIFNWIKNNRYQFIRRANGSTFLEISKSEIGKIPICAPILPEQQKIASFFTVIDQKISQLKRKKTLLEQYKKGVMQKIFSQEIRFKDDNGQEFPKWEKKKLGELTYKTGKKNKGSTPYPIYSINNREGFLPQGDQFEGVDSNSRGYDISLYKIIEEKTFAYNPARINVGSIGFSGDLKDIIISSLYVCFKTKQGLEDAYLLHYLKTFQFNKSVLQNVEGGVRDYLFYENFSNIKINLPSNKEQVKIANFLSAIDDKINHTQKQVEKAEVWKKGLMQQMFV